MAATKSGTAAKVLDALLKAAIALPICTLPAKAGQLETANGGIKYLNYAEGDGRIDVNSPLLWFQGPLAQNYDIALSATLDSVSGASPQYVSNQSGKPVHTLSGASIIENRRAADVKVTRYLGNMSLGATASVSSEHDYLSRGAGIDMRFDFNNKLTTLALGSGVTSDDVGSSIDRSLHEQRLSHDFLIGITQIINPLSLVQSNLSFSEGQGYYNDPYKFTLFFFPGSPAPVLHRDIRPDRRRQTAWLTRYRRFFPAWESALAVDYRYYADDWGVRAHTLDFSWSKNFGHGWKLRPGLRYYSQRQADFYGTVFSSSSGVGSSDERLGSFGALAPSLKVSKELSADTSLDVAVGYYRQEAKYKAGGGGSSDLAPFSARYLMLGLNRQF
ncbi:MAG: DUF3570 domain-containing protein [Sulfuricellaceae bacterium]|nr:DUF3570 domain-containing protein [Sulfuricellaceae bacterium]